MNVDHKKWFENPFAALGVALLLLLAAWGNALAMAIGSCVTLLVGVVLFRKHLNKSIAVAIVAAAVSAFAVALLLHAAR